MLSMWSRFALNSLKDVDIAFFIICAVIIVLIVAVYFLIPVFNKKFYEEQRENLHKREAAFKSNLQNARSVEAEPQANGAEAGEEPKEADTDGEREESAKKSKIPKAK